MDDDKQLPSIQDNSVSSENSDKHTNSNNDDDNRDLELNDSKLNSSYRYVTPTGTLIPTQRNKIKGTMVNDSWDMIDNMPHIKERVINTGKS